MNSGHALFPGTFDPPTLGHLDLLQRAAALFDRVTVAVAEHPTKSPAFAVDQRVELLRTLTSGFGKVEVVRLSGLLVDGARPVGAGVIVRGARSGADFDYEAPMASTNRQLAPEIETVFLAAAPSVAHISSTLVRQIASMGGRVDAFVAPEVAAALRERYEH